MSHSDGGAVGGSTMTFAREMRRIAEKLAKAKQKAREAREERRRAQEEHEKELERMRKEHAAELDKLRAQCAQSGSAQSRLSDVRQRMHAASSTMSVHPSQVHDWKEAAQSAQSALSRMDSDTTSLLQHLHGRLRDTDRRISKLNSTCIDPIRRQATDAMKLAQEIKRSASADTDMKQEEASMNDTIRNVAVNQQREASQLQPSFPNLLLTLQSALESVRSLHTSHCSLTSCSIRSSQEHLQARERFIEHRERLKVDIVERDERIDQMIEAHTLELQRRDQLIEEMQQQHAQELDQLKDQQVSAPSSSQHDALIRVKQELVEGSEALLLTTQLKRRAERALEVTTHRAKEMEEELRRVRREHEAALAAAASPAPYTPTPTSAPHHDPFVCAVCLDERPAVLYYPCKHLVCCSGCTSKLPEPVCPVCSQTIRRRLQVFAS